MFAHNKRKKKQTMLKKQKNRQQSAIQSVFSLVCLFLSLRRDARGVTRERGAATNVYAAQEIG